jgi:hypothetical protein
MSGVTTPENRKLGFPNGECKCIEEEEEGKVNEDFLLYRQFHATFYITGIERILFIPLAIA